MSGPRKIAAVSGTRADYGLLRWTLREISDDPALELQLIATGAHLSHEFGLTYRRIEEDGFTIDAKVDMLLSGDSTVAVTKSLGMGVIGFADALDRLRPDLLMVLGDRYEILAAAQAAMMARIPIAHIHGGESTEGAMDDVIRHAVSKMSHLHFVAAEAYGRRLIQMGEQPENVHVVGGCGLDGIERLQRLTREEVGLELGLDPAKPLFLVTLHPETLSAESAETQATPMLEALARFADARIVITGSNADSAGRALSRLMQHFAERESHRVLYEESLGQQRYLSLLHEADVVIGNSSSGLLEAPSCGTPTVNIGDRQRNRLRAETVVDSANRVDEIAAAIEQALTPEFRQLAAQRQSPYGTPGASRRIKEVLKQQPLHGILYKHFYDLE